jgi:hypothetical protein
MIEVQFKSELFNDIYAQGFKFHDRYLNLYGGAGSGKSIFAGQKILIRILKEDGHRFLLWRKTFRSIRKSQFQLFKNLIKRYNLSELFTIIESEMIIRCINRNEIISAGLDDSEKLKSIEGITGTWGEEPTETTEEDFNQVDLRLRGITPNYKQHILTYNPIDENHWLRKRFHSPGVENTLCIHSTYLDNKFIDEDYKRLLDYYRKSDPSYWQVYGKGDWGTLKFGTIFLPKYYAEYDYLPDDVRGVLYCDPNLAKKSKGDTTAITKLGYSPSTGLYYVLDSLCESFSDSSFLLNALLSMKDDRTNAIGFDGNVTQESVWTDAVRNWCRLHSLPFPPIEYKRYRVDDLAKNANIAWSERRILFPRGFKESPGNKNYLSQLFSFEGKRSGNPDDAPDSFICAFEFLHERNLNKKKSNFTQPQFETDRF